MGTDAYARRELQRVLEEKLGVDAATTLMEHLPTHPWGDVTTTAEVEALLVGLEGRLGRRFDSMDQRFDSMDQRFDSMDRRMDSMDQRMDSMDQRMDSMDQRMDSMDQRFDAIDRRFDAVDRRFEEVDGRFGTVDHRFDVVGIQMETLEHRITASFRGELMKTVIASNLISILGVGSLVIASAKLL
ncbi:MAG: hypothetical protein U0V73_10460 [Acidimicrobiia bacterium]